MITPRDPARPPAGKTPFWGHRGGGPSAEELDVVVTGAPLGFHGSRRASLPRSQLWGGPEWRPRGVSAPSTPRTNQPKHFPLPRVHVHPTHPHWLVPRKHTAWATEMRVHSSYSQAPQPLSCGTPAPLLGDPGPSAAGSWPFFCGTLPLSCGTPAPLLGDPGLCPAGTWPLSCGTPAPLLQNGGVVVSTLSWLQHGHAECVSLPSVAGQPHEATGWNGSDILAGHLHHLWLCPPQTSRTLSHPVNAGLMSSRVLNLISMKSPPLFQCWEVPAWTHHFHIRWRVSGCCRPFDWKLHWNFLGMGVWVFTVLSVFPPLSGKHILRGHSGPFMFSVILGRLAGHHPSGGPGWRSVENRGGL